MPTHSLQRKRHVRQTQLNARHGNRCDGEVSFRGCASTWLARRLPRPRQGLGRRRQIDAARLGECGQLVRRQAAQQELGQLLLPRLPDHRAVGDQRLLQPGQLSDLAAERQQRDLPLDLVAALRVEDPVGLQVVGVGRAILAGSLEEMLPRVDQAFGGAGEGRKAVSPRLIAAGYVPPVSVDAALRASTQFETNSSDRPQSGEAGEPRRESLPRRAGRSEVLST